MRAEPRVEQMPGKVENRVFISGNYGFPSKLREIGKYVSEKGFTPILAIDYKMVEGDTDYTHSLRVLNNCRYAIFEVTELRGEALEIKDAAEGKAIALTIAVYEAWDGGPKEPPPRISSMLKGLGIPMFGYKTPHELRDLIAHIFPGVKEDPKATEASFLGNVGLVLMDLDQTKGALGMFDKALRIRREMGVNLGSPLLDLDPFDIPAQILPSLSLNHIYLLYHRLFLEYGEWVREELKRSKAQFIVVCNRKVVLTSNDPRGPPADRVREIAEETGKICYTIGGEDLIEESADPVPWSNLEGGDYYPTVEVFIGNHEWEDERVFRDGVRVIADFDTGNPDIYAFGEGTCRRVAAKPPWYLIQVKHHLGMPYSFYSLKLKIGVRDEGLNQRCILRTARGILLWEDETLNPFKRVNPGRNGFVGRDLMLGFPLSVTLNPKLRSSTIHLF